MSATTSKTCATCSVVKTEDDFYFIGIGRLYRSPHCKPCANRERSSKYVKKGRNVRHAGKFDKHPELLEQCKALYAQGKNVSQISHELGNVAVPTIMRAIQAGRITRPDGVIPEPRRGRPRRLPTVQPVVAVVETPAVVE